MLTAGAPTATVSTAHHDPTSKAILSLFQQLEEDQTLPRFFFVRAFPFDPTSGSVAEQKFAQAPWEPKLSEKFLPRVQEAINFQSNVLSGELATNLGGPPAFGAIRVAVNPDAGDTDDFVRLFWDNRDVEVYMGGEGFAIADFEVVQKARSVNIAIDTAGYTLNLRDPSLGLRDPIQASRYAGTGDPATPSSFLDGGEDLTDRERPIGFGAPLNITPQVIDRRAAGLVYQFHDRAARAVDAVYDQGVPLTAHNGGANDIADLGLATVWDWDPTGNDGEYITDLSQGLIRLASPPEGTVTADVQCDDEGGVLADTIPDIVERILRQRAGFTDAELDLPSFALLRRDNPGKASFYLQSGSRSLIQVVTELLDDLLAFWRFNRLGEFSVGQLRQRPPIRTIPKERVISIESPEDPAPHKGRDVQYAESHTVQDEDTLAGAATDAHAGFVSQRFRTVNLTDATVAATRLGAVEQTIATHFDDASDATAEGQRQLDLLAQDRRIWEVTLDQQQFRFIPGNIVRVEFPRWGFENGKNGIVIGVVERSRSQQTTLRIWA